MPASEACHECSTSRRGRLHFIAMGTARRMYQRAIESASPRTDAWAWTGFIDRTRRSKSARPGAKHDGGLLQRLRPFCCVVLCGAVRLSSPSGTMTRLRAQRGIPASISQSVSQSASRPRIRSHASQTIINLSSGRQRTTWPSPSPSPICFTPWPSLRSKGQGSWVSSPPTLLSL